MSTTIRQTTEPRVGSWSPWDRIDFVSKVAEGIVNVGTPGHGGVWLSVERLEALPVGLKDARTWCGYGNWFEEDCDWCIPALAFPEEFAGEAARGQLLGDWLSQAHNTAARHHRAAYAAWQASLTPDHPQYRDPATWPEACK